MTMIRRDAPDQPEQSGTVADGDGTTRHFTTVSWRPGNSGGDRDNGYLLTISIAFALLIGVAAATMYVSFAAQVDYISAHKDDGPAVYLAAVSWDLAAVVFGLLGLATAMRGDSALRARMGNLLCVAASVAMNAAPATWDDPGSMLVWVGPPLLYAGVSDTIILEVQRRAMDKRGLENKHASIWGVLALILWGIVGVIAWVLRLVFAPKETIVKFRQWYLAEVAYAPGRTVAGDQAAAAELRAGSAEEIAERVRDESRAAVEAAEARATARIREAEQEAQERIQQTEEHAAEQVEAVRSEQAERADSGIAAERRLREQQQDQHQAVVEELESETNRLRRELDRTATNLREARAEAEQGRGYERQLTEVRAELDRTERLRSEALASVRQQQEENTILFAALSGRQQVEHLYDRLARHGDPRHGDPARVHELAEEFLRQGVKIESANTVARYLREHLSESGPQLAAVAGGSDASMGGAL